MAAQKKGRRRGAPKKVGASPDSDILFGSLQDLAAWLQMPEGTIRNSWRNHGLPSRDDELWSARDTALWLKAGYQRRTSARTEDPNSKRKLLAEAEKTELQNERARFAFERERGDLVSKAAVRLEVSEFLTRFRDGVARIPAKIRAIVPREHVEEVVRLIDQQLRLECKALVNNLLHLESLDSPGGGATEEAVE